jgi:hypothetical protein
MTWASPPTAQSGPHGKLISETLAGKLEFLNSAQLDALRFAPDAVAFLRYEGERPGVAAVAAAVDLLDGQRWCGSVAGGTGDTLRWRSGVGAELALSIDHIAAIEFFGRLSAPDRAAMQPAPEGDRLYWLHGDALERIDGTFESFSDEGVLLDGVLGRRTFPWSEVGALFVAALETPPLLKPATGTALVLDLADGSRIRAGFQKAGANGLALSYPGLARLDLAFEQLIEAGLDDGSFRYLSTLMPTTVQEGSLFGDEMGLAWPHRVDRSVVGGELSVAGQVFARGLGVHAPSRLEWKLDALVERQQGAHARPALQGGVRELYGSVGIDDSVRATSARGCVKFQVFVDGEMRWESGLIRGGERAAELPRIDLRNAKELALVVDVAEDSFVADRADWLRLILVAGR